MCTLAAVIYAYHEKSKVPRQPPPRALEHVCSDYIVLTQSNWNPHTAHTINPVPAILFNGPKNKSLHDGGRLSDIAPTILELMELSSPPEMTGKSLLS